MPNKLAEKSLTNPCETSHSQIRPLRSLPKTTEVPKLKGTCWSLKPPHSAGFRRPFDNSLEPKKRKTSPANQISASGYSTCCHLCRIIPFLPKISESSWGWMQPRCGGDWLSAVGAAERKMRGHRNKRCLG